jgi:hypothetical protein
MAITRALEFDQTPNRLLFQIAENARAQQLADQKLKLDEQRKRQEIYNMINPSVLSKDYEKEVVSRNLSAIQEAAANYEKQNPNGSLTDLRMFLNSQIGKTAEQSARVKTYKDNVDKYVAAVGKDSIYDTERLRAMLYDRGLFKADQTGLKNLKPAEEINEDVQSYVDQILSEDPDLVVSKVTGAKNLQAAIKDASLFEENIMSERDSPNGMQTVITGTKSKIPFYLEVKKRNVKKPTGMVEESYLDVKKQANGLIDESVFNQIYSDPPTAAYINSLAKDIMKQAGIESTPENMEVYKRTALTDFLERNKKGAIENVNKTLIQPPRAASSGVGTEKEPPITVDVFSLAQAVIDSGQKVQLSKGGKVTDQPGFPVSLVDQSAKKIIIDDVNAIAQFQPTKDDTPRNYNQDDLIMKPIDSKTIGIHEYPSLKFLTKFTKREANVKASKALGGQKSAAESQKQETATSTQPAAKPSGKVMSSAEWKKLPVSERIRLKNEGYTFK